MKTTDLLTLKETSAEKDTLIKDVPKSIMGRSLRPMKSMMKNQSVKPGRMGLKNKLRKKVIKF